MVTSSKPEGRRASGGPRLRPMSDPAPMSGRKAQAARNDELILAAARSVFIENPDAPIALVAERAGVGISALYRRYPSKEELLAKLCLDGLRTYIAVLEEALETEDDPWESFARFLRNAVAAGTSSLTVKLAGTFTPTEEHWADSQKAFALNHRMMERVRSAGVVRDDFEEGDWAMIMEMLAGLRLGDDDRSAELRQRYLQVILDGLRVPAARSELPARGPVDDELSARWSPP